MARKTKDDWDLDEGPSAEVRLPSEGRVRTAKAALYVVLACAVVSVPITAMAGAAALNGLTASSNTQSGQPVVSSPGRAAATVALAKWLTSDPAPLPGGQVVTWDGATTIPTAVTTDDSGRTVSPTVGFVSEIDTFSVVDGASRMYTAAVQVQVDPRTNTGVAVGTPSLIPVVSSANDSWQQGGPWPGLSTTGATDTIRKTVTGWAGAYTSGDSDSLRIAVGDPDPSHMFLPLSGVDGAVADVTAAALLHGADPSVMVVQVRLYLHWAGQLPLTAAQQASKDRPSVTVDLLVERANTAAPVVTAWGAPGAGPTLTRYRNAVPAANRPATSPSAQTTPTSSPTPTSSRS